MTLSHIHLPSISSVLTSERVFLPGHYRSTRLDMGAAETKSLPNPDFLMKTIHLDEAPRVGQLVSSIGYNLDTIVEEEESDSDALTMTDQRSSTLRGISSRSHSSSNDPKHDRGVLASALWALYSTVIRAFAPRRSSKSGGFSS